LYSGGNELIAAIAGAKYGGWRRAHKSPGNQGDFHENAGKARRKGVAQGQGGVHHRSRNSIQPSTAGEKKKEVN